MSFHNACFNYRFVIQLIFDIDQSTIIYSIATYLRELIHWFPHSTDVHGVLFALTSEGLINEEWPIIE